MERSQHRKGQKVIGSFIDALTWNETIKKIQEWVDSKESRYICICNSHSLVTANSDRNFQKALNEADMATPDGAPVAWMLRRLGYSNQDRINGPDLMLRYIEKASLRGESIFLYGSTDETLSLLQKRLMADYPGISIAGSYSPPFRILSQAELDDDIDRINASGASTVWVSLGCPKQEIWMNMNSHKINSVLIGVGAAFDYHAGVIKRAPQWFQENGLEWFYRLLSEPRRLWRRYFFTNTVFIFKASLQLLKK